MKKSLLISAIFLILFLIFSCQDQINEPIERPDTPGQVDLKIDLSAAPENVVAIKGYLMNETDTLKFDFLIQNGYAEAHVEGISVGRWQLKVDALDEAGNVIYSGETEVIVEGGEITPIYLQLNPVTGSLEIIVTWGDRLPKVIAYFPFEYSLSDLSIFHNNASAFTDIKFSDGVFGKAIEFDGDEDYIQIPHLDAYNHDEKTIAFWFMKTNDYIENTPDWDDVEGLVFKSYNTSLYRDFSFLIGQQNPPFRLVFNVYNYGDSLIFLREYEVIRPNTWYHIAGVINEHSAKLYINGELVKVKEFPGQLYHNDAPITLGSVPPVDRMIYRYFKGKIDEFVIFSKALTSDEIKTLISTGNPF